MTMMDFIWGFTFLIVFGVPVTITVLLILDSLGE
jgi:hypothetical protein